MDNKIGIAIDGPAGAGKSTIAKRISKALDIEYIDTGAMYRALTYKVLEMGIDPKDKESVIRILKETDIDFIKNSIYLDGKNVDREIRLNGVSKNVSYIAEIEEVRRELVKKQQDMSHRKSVIMDGRDIGTVVLAHAKYKFFIVASVEERARRRHEDLLSLGDNTSIEELILEIEKRDAIDSNREFSPLKKAENAILIDTTYNTIEESVNSILSYINGGH